MKAMAGMAYLLGVLFLGVGLALPVGARTTYADGLSATPEDCVLAVNWEANDGDPTSPEPDPTSTYAAEPGFQVCRVVLKVGAESEGGHQMTFTSDGCQGPISTPEGYCVSGMGTGSATGARVCDNEGDPRGCPLLSHAKYWVEPAPTPTPTETPTETPTDLPPTDPPPTATATPTKLPPPPPPLPPTEMPPTGPAPTQPAPTQLAPPQSPVIPTVAPPVPIPVTGGAQSPFLIPVTGVDFAGQAHPTKGLFQNLGLAFLGLGLGMHGLSLRQPREE